MGISADKLSKINFVSGVRFLVTFSEQQKVTGSQSHKNKDL